MKKRGKTKKVLYRQVVFR